MTKPRPVCGQCGKPYGSRVTKQTVVVWKHGHPPAHRGAGIVTRTEPMGVQPQSYAGSREGVSFEAGDRVAIRTIWDGETWNVLYEPFCTLRCALAYARAAFLANDKGKTSWRAHGNLK